MMTAASVTGQRQRRSPLDTLVARTAQAMLRWADDRTERRRPNHEHQQILLSAERAFERTSAQAARLSARAE